MAKKEDIIKLHKKQLKLEIDTIRLAISHSAANNAMRHSAIDALANY